jgi:UDP-N-acetylglucosamine 2-epimerase (non-hydrolysing)
VNHGPTFTAGFDPVNTLRPIFVVGTRPEAIKIFPVVLAMRADPRLDPIVIASGQHPDMCSQVLRMAGIEPDISLTLKRKTGSLNELVSGLLSELTGVFEDLVAKYNPTGYLPRLPGTFVHGDTSTALAAALVSAFADVPVVHVEAGLRTYDLHGPFPEELNRQLIARIAIFSIAPTMPSEANLIRESISSEQIMVAGNTGIDALLWATAQPVAFSDPQVADLVARDEPLIVVTAHRRENWDHLDDIADAILRICEARSDLRVVLPLHPNPKVREVLAAQLDGQPQVLLTEPLEYVEFAHLLKRATIALTDSGGIQEEAPSLHTPVLVMREQTERPEGVLAGTLKLVGTDPDAIVSNTLKLLEDRQAYEQMSSAENPYGDGKASERIVQAFNFVLTGQDAPHPFGPGFSRSFVLSRTGLDYASLPHQQRNDDA